MNRLASHRLTRGDLTRDAVLQTAMTAFAEAGYDQVSLRALAIRAGVNQSLIGYHFGHKRGLYQAVFVAIAGQVRARLDPEMTLVESALHDSAPGGRGREDEFRALFRLTDGLLDLMTDPGTDAWAQLIIREQQQPTEAFDVLYSGFMDRLLTLVARLIGRLRGSMPAPEARLLAFTVLGQILVFRVARAGVLRALAWSDIDAGAVEAIRARLHGNLRALLAAPGS